jgi:hypothetical protein
MAPSSETICLRTLGVNSVGLLAMNAQREVSDSDLICANSKMSFSALGTP